MTVSPPAGEPVDTLSNRTFDEIAIGDTTAVERTLTAEDIRAFSLLSGASDPFRQDATKATAAFLQGMVAHGMWAGALLSAVVGTRLPGPGTTYLGETLRFLSPVQAGDTLTLKVEVAARDPITRQIQLRCDCTNQNGDRVIEGSVDVIAPAEKVIWTRTALPEVRLTIQSSGMKQLLDHARPLGAVKVAVVHPCDEVSLSSAVEARTAGLIDPVLVAPRARLESIARTAGLDISGMMIEDVPHSHGAAQRAGQLASSGAVEALMKGSLHTDELMAAVVASGSGLRTKRRVTHCFVIQTPAYPRPFIVTDAAVNIAPSLPEKVDIVQNAIDLAQVLGVKQPRVAILAAVETVSPRMQATLDAAALCKMADRGQITGGVVDGPLAFDIAVSAAAAKIKGIVSPVAGQADILVVPDLESGNMLAKQLEYIGNADSAGIALGAKVPIILPSRADARATRLASCAIAVLLAHHYRASPP
ncbi:bifunctional enoyl-CoA hydratase/phosphate acetyltransferase [Microvirga mediterraneensis]|uniref:Bifunctional enoyl-CoA hydratase/phosphate acetyltransferase n=1 Tax=Microvirga mediterraneensis TaxID=2754695 RepID=A0A838BW25_9HYPH|nr:bifunctional enoyl-CoA hydratase/phosphate acetyltransferase [Microvirga mediterraneensis]MBA1159083.1 bifunctional enoyl-CoA hydratase/phosphate acetyltransferase [Microvirga mediterraneensis]